MGHFLFLVLHLIALFAGGVLLFLTIPLHVIYAYMRSRGEAAARAQAATTPSPATHVRCPDCKELVLKEATVCKHCRCKLIPQ